VASFTSAPGFTFNKPVTADIGTPFSGIAAGNTTLTGTISLQGVTEADILNDANVALAFRRTVAISATTPTLNVTEDMVALKSGSSAGRRLLTAVISYTITLTPAQAAAAPSMATAIATSLVAGNATFVATFKSQAEAVSATAIALNQYLSASGQAPTISTASGQFSFTVSDSTGPTLVALDPPSGAVDLPPSTVIVLTFSENVQAGTGSVVVSNPGTDEQPGITRHIDVGSSQISFSGSSMRIMPESWLAPGDVTITIAAGVITDDRQAGTAAVNAFAGIHGAFYRFTVSTPPPPPPAPSDQLSIGVSPGGGSCTYTLTDPFYMCEGENDCHIFLKPSQCGDQTSTQARSVSYETLQKLQQPEESEDQRRAEGEGPDLHPWKSAGEGGEAGAKRTVISFGNGRIWPEGVASDFA
jgi:hypothetical protein